MQKEELLKILDEISSVLDEINEMSNTLSLYNERIEKLNKTIDNNKKYMMNDDNLKPELTKEQQTILAQKTNFFQRTLRRKQIELKKEIELRKEAKLIKLKVDNSKCVNDINNILVQVQLSKLSAMNLMNELLKYEYLIPSTYLSSDAISNFKQYIYFHGASNIDECINIYEQTKNMKK